MSQRSAQVAEELRKIISNIFLKDVNDPRVGFITVTRIELTNDLRYARVYYSVLGDQDSKQATVEALEENLSQIRRLAIQRINMKFAPEMHFILDTSIEKGMEIENILKKIKKQEKEGS